MGKFRISTHGRLHDWIAVEKGYFEDEGLDYEIDVRALIRPDSPTSGWARTSCTVPEAVARRR
jgi:hypothetical protein